MRIALYFTALQGEFVADVFWPSNIPILPVPDLAPFPCEIMIGHLLKHPLTLKLRPASHSVLMGGPPFRPRRRCYKPFL